MTSLQTVGYETLGLPQIFLDYLAGRAELRGRFPGDPFDPHASLTLAAALRDRDYPRLELVSRLLGYNQELEAGEATLQNIEALKKPTTCIVCTGQQPGVLTGPLYTIYKAITCVTVARRLSSLADETTFIPLFWCASEDHDLEEMNHIHMPGPQGEPLRLRTELRNDGRPAECVKVSAALREFLEEAIDRTPDTEFRDEVVALFDPEPGDTLGTWFNRILLGLFGDDGLVVAEPRLLRDLATPIIRRELDTAPRTSELLRRAGAELERLGYEPPFDGKPKVHCFYLGDQRRGRIRFYADFCILGDGRVDRRELPYHLEDHAERFSPDAALRPVLQSAVLPVATYVAGPGEIAYHAQLRELHEAFDVPMPVIYPRASVTLIEASVARAMETYGLGAADIFTTPEGRTDLLAASSKGASLAAALEALAARNQTELENLEGRIAELDPGIARVVKKVRGRLKRELGYLTKKVTGAIDDAAGVGRSRLLRLFGNTFPKGQPQERVFNIFYYLAKYGPDLPRSLLRDLQDAPRQHVVYSLSAYTELPAGAGDVEEPAAGTAPEATRDDDPEGGSWGEEAPEGVAEERTEELER